MADFRTTRAHLVDAFLGFRIVAIRDGNARAEAQYQRLNEEGKVLGVAPASLRELQLYQLLVTPESNWGELRR